MNSNNRNLPIRFGVKTLDRLISPRASDITEELNEETWTASLIGPDGCGKSILGLHLASTYWNDTRHLPNRPKVIYVSTDLSLEQAQRQWRNFGLDYPTWREAAIDAAYDCRDRSVPLFDLEKGNAQIAKN